MLCQETYFSRRGVFPHFDYDQSRVKQHCSAKFGAAVTPRTHWISQSYGGRRALEDPKQGFSNIVFTNGEFDPWRAAGVNDLNVTARDIVSLLVKEGAHHLDLMFATDKDPQSVRDVRRVELEYISKWEAEAVLVTS